MSCKHNWSATTPRNDVECTICKERVDCDEIYRHPMWKLSSFTGWRPIADAIVAARNLTAPAPPQPQVGVAVAARPFPIGSCVYCIRKPDNFGKWCVGKLYIVGTDPVYPNSICDDDGIAYDTEARGDFWSAFTLDPLRGAQAQTSSAAAVATEPLCTCDFRGPNAFLGCRCGAFAKSKAGT